MAKFYVGQRVRIVNVSSPRNGCEGRIVSYRESINQEHGLGMYWEVDVEGFGRFDPEDGLVYAYPSHNLEPITPPHEACDPSSPSPYAYSQTRCPLDG